MRIALLCLFLTGCMNITVNGSGVVDDSDHQSGGFSIEALR